MKREKCVDIILQSKQELNLRYETCLQAIDIFDRVIASNQLLINKDEDFLTLTYTSLMISIKFHEVNMERELFKKTYSL